MEHIAIVIPAYNERKILRKNMSTLAAVLDEDAVDFSVTLVDDGSADDTWKIIEAINREDPRFGGIRFSRNFGKEAALCAGLRAAEGDLYLTMDSDLQHPPRCIKEMLAIMAAENVDIVEGIKRLRGKERLVYKFCAGLFYKLFKVTTSVDMNDSSDFKLMRPKVAEAICSFKEGNVFFRGLVSWIGFKKVEYAFDVEERKGDSSKFTMRKLVKMVFNSMLSYTAKPLYYTFAFGFLFLLFSVILGIQTLINYFGGSAISGFTTVILLLLIIGAFMFLSFGLIGMYIGRIYEEVKRRPQYLIAENIEPDSFGNRKPVVEANDESVSP